MSRLLSTLNPSKRAKIFPSDEESGSDGRVSPSSDEGKSLQLELPKPVRWPKTKKVAVDAVKSTGADS